MSGKDWEMQQAIVGQLSDIPEAHVPAAAVSGRGAEECCVLVVDDETAVRLFVARVLESAGYAVVGAGDGLEALEVLDRRRSGIDLVLTDIRMPGLDGVELGRRIAGRRLPVPVAYMSADPPGQMVCLQKPFSMTALLELVNALTAERRKDRRA
jgi:CheY-like chemotaxis protein